MLACDRWPKESHNFSIIDTLHPLDTMSIHNNSMGHFIIISIILVCLFIC